MIVSKIVFNVYEIYFLKYPSLSYLSRYESLAFLRIIKTEMEIKKMYKEKKFYLQIKKTLEISRRNADILRSL